MKPACVALSVVSALSLCAACGGGSPTTSLRAQPVASPSTCETPNAAQSYYEFKKAQIECPPARPNLPRPAAAPAAPSPLATSCPISFADSPPEPSEEGGPTTRFPGATTMARTSDATTDWFLLAGTAQQSTSEGHIYVPSVGQIYVQRLAKDPCVNGDFDMHEAIYTIPGAHGTARLTAVRGPSVTVTNADGTVARFNLQSQTFG